MEVASSLAGALRIGVQVATGYKGPHLEIYWEVMNLMGPEVEYPLPWTVPGRAREVHKSRDQQVVIQLQIVNIGGQRAENISVFRSGSFRRRYDDVHERDRLRLIPQMAPGQAVQLFLLDQFELDQHDKEGRRSGFQPGDLVLEVEYDSPAGIVNALKTLPARLLRRSAHHQSSFRFNAAMIEGDLPPARYS